MLNSTWYQVYIPDTKYSSLYMFLYDWRFYIMYYLKNLLKKQRYYCIPLIQYILLQLISYICETICFPVLVFKNYASEYCSDSYQTNYAIDRFLEEVHATFDTSNSAPYLNILKNTYDNGTIQIQSNVKYLYGDKIFAYNIFITEKCLSIPLDVLKPLLVHEMAHMRLRHNNMDEHTVEDFKTEVMADELVLVNGYDIEHSLDVMFKEQLMIGNILDAYILRKRIKLIRSKI